MKSAKKKPALIVILEKIGREVRAIEHHEPGLGLKPHFVTLGVLCNILSSIEIPDGDVPFVVGRLERIKKGIRGRAKTEMSKYLDKAAKDVSKQ